MATLRKKGRYYYARFYDASRKPSRKEVALGTTYKDAAKAKLREKEVAYAQGEWDPWAPEQGPVRALTVKKAAERFLESKSHRRPVTVRNYKTYLDQWSGTLPPGLMLAHVDAGHLRPYVWESDLTPNALRARARHLKVFFSWAMRAGHIKANPFDHLEIPREERNVPTYIQPEDVNEVIKKIEDDYDKKFKEGKALKGEIIWLRDVIKFAVATGLRRSEICSLTWDGVDLKNKHIVVGRGHDTKSHHQRIVPLAKPALEILRAKKKASNTEFVFPGRRGGKLNGDYLGKQFKSYARKAKLPEDVNFHSLRHTCASWLVMNGVPLRVVGEILGHAPGSYQVTQRYAHLAPGATREAVDKTFGGL